MQGEEDETDGNSYIDEVGLYERDLVLMETKDLNQLIRKKGLTRDKQQEVKKRRRTLKNRLVCVCDCIFFGEDGLAIQNYYFIWLLPRFRILLTSHSIFKLSRIS
jgi:hypothetical protein